MAIDFQPRYKDYAVFCPAISSMLVKFEANKNPKRPMPAGMQQKDLNFLDENCNLYHIPYALYSAGQASKSDKTKVVPDMITLRDRANTTLIGDSGGYQIQTNAIKFNGDSTVHRMMNWLEDTCDWSMILDFPTGGILAGSVDQHTERLNKELSETPYSYTFKGKTYIINSIEEFANVIGFDNPDSQKIGFATCLLQTIQNNEYFIKNRTPGKTNFLNVIQGRNVEESDIWYERVKHFEFDAWSLAGPHKENFVMTMLRFVDMWHDGLLENKNWTHILGVGKLQHGCVYTTIQRYIRENINPNFTISYDVSSPFTTTAFGNIFMGYTLSSEGWTLQSGWVDGLEYLNGKPKSQIPFLEELAKVYDKKGLTRLEDGGTSRFIETEIGKKLKMGDICVNSNPDQTSTWDVVAYAMLMNHNLQVHLEGVFEAQDLYDHDDTTHVPHGLLRLKTLIPEIFDCYKENGREAAREMILKHRNELNYLAGDAAKSGVPDYSEFEIPVTKLKKKTKKAAIVEKKLDLGLFE